MANRRFDWDQQAIRQFNKAIMKTAIWHIDTRAEFIYVNSAGGSTNICMGRFRIYVNGRMIEDDPQFYVYLDLSLLELESDIVSKRKTMMGMIEQLTDKQLNKAGHHPRFGRLSIYDWVEFFLLHEAHHLFTIYTLTHVST